MSAERKLPDLNEPLSDWEKALLEKFFTDPSQLPAKFKTWVSDYVSTNGNFNVSSVPTLKGEEWREVGASGQPAFAGTWTNTGGGTIPARFCKNVLGWVHLEGHVRSGGANLIFTLPSGYWPSGETHFACKSWNGAAEVYGAARVLADGQVLLVAGNSNDFSLATIQFRAA